MPTDVQHLAYSQSSEHQIESVRCLMAVFELFGVPVSMLDVGCGPGAMVRAANKRGVAATGFDICASGENLVQADLCEPLPWGRPADLVLCWEVAEHLPPEAADTLADTLVKLTVLGGRLVFTAAVPGQTGAGHINEQPHSYWREKLEQRGLRYFAEESDKLRTAWRASAGRCQWYPKNVQVFRA